MKKTPHQKKKKKKKRKKKSVQVHHHIKKNLQGQIDIGNLII